MASERESGLARNELLLQYIQELGYGVDFKTSLAKLEKNADGRFRPHHRHHRPEHG